MKSKPNLITILVVAIGGALFSGYLSYYTLFTTGCSEALITCGGANPVLIVGLPTCVYGLVMFAAVAVLAVIGLKKITPQPWQKAVLWISVVGVLFSGSLSYYELYLRDPKPENLPACVYGFFFYLVIFLVSLAGARAKKDLAPTEGNAVGIFFESN